ncbi:uncharacterized protein DEA37_0000611 [Paragonimus westermani]|uniref:Uncharacterized protein n=1 Tax=Paragonimus westermani TaxID=34504 RepID=A0A5J4NB07_9TREM|nr:uncharacterized protein DEA37_0000611 [Paragonimus westermani]
MWWPLHWPWHPNWFSNRSVLCSFSQYFICEVHGFTFPSFHLAFDRTMNSVISSYLRGAPSPLGVSEAVKNLTRILENSHTGRLSPSLLEAFLLGDCSILRFMANNVNCDSQGVITLLNRFRERGFLSSGSLSLEQLHKSLSLIFIGMKTHMTSDFWKPTVDFLTSSDILWEIIKSEDLLNNICNPLLSLYALNSSMGEAIRSHAQQLYCKLLNASVSQFTEEPSIKILRSAVLLINFGFVLVKLAPAQLTFLLDKIMNSLHVITSGSPERKQQLDRLRNGNGRLNLMDVVKFSPTVSLLICSLLPFICRSCFPQASQLLLFPILSQKLLSLFASMLPRVPCHILSIMKSLIVLLPELTMEEQTFQLILKILMEGIRLPVSVTLVSGFDDDGKENVQNMQPAIFVLKVLVKLVDIWHCFEVPSERRAGMMYQLFDLLRVFPCSLEHAEFVSPFLANLIGRYLSISAPMGDPPTLQLDESVLSHNSYQLLVGLVHWLRLLSGHSACLPVRADYTTIATDCLPTMSVDRIWIECVRCVLGASCAAPPSFGEEQTMEILFDLLIKLAELGGSWMRRNEKLSSTPNGCWSE